MGIASIFDLVGSVIIGGVLLITLFKVNDNVTRNTYSFSGELVVQENLVTSVEVLEYDFRKIGYCEDPFAIPNTKRAILYADSTDITFLTDVDFDGVPDIMRYYLGPPSELSGTPNPDDRMLYQEINGNTAGVNLGITLFKIKYFGALGEELSLPRSFPPTGIFSMQIDIRIENTAAYDEDYRYAFWRQIRLASRNLDNR
jgi:hypothetical protein